MLRMLLPILIVVGANTLYNICAKSTPENLNTFASLAVTYFVAMLASLGLYYITAPEKQLFRELSKANWTTYALGLAIIGLEYGFLCVYRSGWKISTANLVASILLTCVLLVVGVLLYKETLSARQLAGMVVCAVGLIMVAK